MSSEDDLKRYQLDQERQLFHALEEIQRRERRSIEVPEFVDAFVQRRLRKQRMDKLLPQIVTLGRMAGMSGLDAHKWASIWCEKVNV
jgi:hypothetical protein